MNDLVKITLVCFLKFMLWELCISEQLALYSPNDLEATDVLVKRENDSLTLLCEVRGDTETVKRTFVWNDLSGNGAGGERQFVVVPEGPSVNSTFIKQELQLTDSGHYMCSAEPFSITKYILVQAKGPPYCARTAFWCGKHCVLPVYVCDGYEDCEDGEDESPQLCGPRPCDRHDRLNCTSGRCIPDALCCRAGAAPALCRQHSCCLEHHKYSRADGFEDFPLQFEDRHAPDDYGFIRSTIYTVTACALMFMVGVVFLVSALCKMHMKRTALRHAARRDAPRPAPSHRYPPCYEASRLLEERQAAAADHDQPPAAGGEAESESGGFGLTRFSGMFTPMYRQVPTQCYDVEMTDVRSASLNNSPTRSQTLNDYRSPTYCDLNTDLYFNPEMGECGRDLNMATPVEIYRRQERRPLTLQLGRFQLSIPRFGRRSSTDRRPDTPNVAEINIDELDFVRLNSNETYTLNGRTIRLLGANFENYPGSSRPPPYNEAMRYKVYGPPPEYLSRDTLRNSNADDEARSNVEMPPGYDELAGTSDNNNLSIISNVNGNATNLPTVVYIAGSNATAVTNVSNVSNGISVANVANVSNGIPIANVSNATSTRNVANVNNATAVANANDVSNGISVANLTNVSNVTSIANVTVNNVVDNDAIAQDLTNANTGTSNISSVIDNLPAIDSDVNANEATVRN